MDKNLTLILLGPQGSGKGTQAEMLKKDYPFQYVAGGDIARELSKRADKLGQKVKALVRSGQLIPDKILIEGLKERLRTFRGKPLIIDAIPRNKEQHRLLEPLLKKFDRQPIIVVIQLPRKLALDRLMSRKICENCGFMPPYPESKNLRECPRCGGVLRIRSDDTLEAISERLDTYEQETMPLVADFESGGNKVIKVNGAPAPKKVYLDLKSKLNRYLQGLER